MKNALSMSGCLRQRIASALLVLGVVVGALASTATPAHAAAAISSCFQRPAGPDPLTWQVRVDLRVWNQATKAWQYAGQYAWINISPTAPTCISFVVPPQYQNFHTTLIVDHWYTKNGTTFAFRGIPALPAPPGGTWFVQNPLPIITYLANLSSVDGILNIHTAYWH